MDDPARANNLLFHLEWEKDHGKEAQETWALLLVLRENAPE
jgi:hypothetical protein